MKDTTLSNYRRAMHAARVYAKSFLDDEGIPKEDQGIRRVLSRKWRRRLAAIHTAAGERIDDLRRARREEKRFLGDL